MTHHIQFQTARATLGAALLALAAACADVPSSPSRIAEMRPSSNIPDARDQAEHVTFRSDLGTRDAKATAPEFTATTRGGVAMIEAWRLGAGLDDPTPPVALRVFDRGARGVASVRRSRSTLRLPDGRVAIVERESLADGTPTMMRARVDGAEFVWTRSWVRRGDRNELVGSVVESRLHGAVVSRSILSVQGRRLAAAPRRMNGVPKYLLAMSHRFGSLAGTVLLPRALKAQTDGMVCNGASKALTAAWTAWRIATVSWFVSMAVGGVVKGTLAELTASAAVDVAEANYIDCYVAATAAGVPDYRIAQPPIADEA